MPDGSSGGGRDNYRNLFFFGAFYFLCDFANNAYPMHLLNCVHLTKKGSSKENWKLWLCAVKTMTN